MLIENLFLNIGAMKAGTTWLYSMMADHPDIHFSLEKEIHYFAHVDTNHRPLERSQRYDRFKSFVNSGGQAGLPVAQLQYKLAWYTHYLSDPIDDQWYIRLFTARNNSKYCADFSNLYSHLEKDGWDHVKASAENLRVVYIMRHPLKRLWSHLKFHAQFTRTLDSFQNMKPSEYSEMARKPFIWENGEYAKVVRRLQENLSEDQYRIVFFEDIHDGPLNWLRDLEAFLGISAGSYNTDRLSERVNVSHSIKMPQFFGGLFLEDFKKETKALESLGYRPPDAWRDIV